MTERIDKFEHFHSLVGAEGIKKALQDSAIEAINSGDWHRVRAIADFALKGSSLQGESYSNKRPDPLTKLEDIDLTNQLQDFDFIDE
jgi:hypothetical protein